MDLSNFSRLSSLLLILFLVLFGEGSCFLAKKHARDGAVIRKLIRLRGIDLQTAVREIRDKRRPVKTPEPRGDKTPEPRDHTHLNDHAKKELEAARAGNSRVSYRECNLETSRRLDCGFYGVTEEACAQRECCYGETTEPDVPWCYHSLPTINSQCLLDKTERLECGYYGIRKEQCLDEGCCWQPTNDGSVPWCYHKIEIPIFIGECGVPAISPTVLSRIVGGVEVVPHSYPWMVSLQIDQDHFCGGSLINEQWIVTAAHCEPAFWWGSDKEVVLGMHSQSTSETSQIRMEIDKILPHEDYGSQSGMDNDIMLLKLKRPIEFSDEISPVCLPEGGSQVQAGKRCYTTGWGHTRFMGSAPDRLQQVMVPIIETEVCNAGGWYGGSIDDTMICAGYEEGGRDSCQGDSGGPLICYLDGHWNLVGVVSWGDGCASERKPGIYAKVSNYIDWIGAKINEFA